MAEITIPELEPRLEGMRIVPVQYLGPTEVSAVADQLCCAATGQAVGRILRERGLENTDAAPFCDADEVDARRALCEPLIAYGRGGRTGTQRYVVVPEYNGEPDLRRAYGTVAITRHRGAGLVDGRGQSVPNMQEHITGWTTEWSDFSNLRAVYKAAIRGRYGISEPGGLGFWDVQMPFALEGVRSPALEALTGAFSDTNDRRRVGNYHIATEDRPEPIVGLRMSGPRQVLLWGLDQFEHR